MDFPFFGEVIVGDMHLTYRLPRINHFHNRLIQMDGSFLHARDKESVLQLLSSNEQTGLSIAQVVAAWKTFGANDLATVAPESIWKKLLAQFSDVVV